jgi:hypothetical protein
MRRTRRVWSGFAVFLLAVVLPLAGLGGIERGGAFHEETLLDSFPKPSLVTTPVVGGGWAVAWLALTGELDDEGYTIAQVKVARLPERAPDVIAEVGVTDATAFTFPLDTDGVVVVWADLREGNVIRGSRLASGEEFVVAELDAPAEIWPSPVTSLAVSDNWVVWSSHDGAVARVQARNVAAMGEVITLASAVVDPEGVAPLGGVDADSGWVVWGEGWTGYTWDTVIVRPLDAPEPVRPYDNDDEHERGDYRLASGMLALAFLPPGVLPASNVAGVRVIELATEAEREVIFDYGTFVAPYPYVAGLVGFDGRYLHVAFQLSIPTSNPGLQQVVAYDLHSDSIFGVLRDVPRLVGTTGVVIFWETGRYGATVHAARLADRIPTAVMPYVDPADHAFTYFTETGHFLSWGFKGYWERHGGLPVFGYPLTEEYLEQNGDTGQFYVTQYFERQRFEWHPENTDTPYEVLLGRLGAELLLAHGRNWTEFPSADPSAPHYIPATGHAIAPEFWDYWSSHGLDLGDPSVSFRESLALFGYPLSEPMTETNADGDTVLTQYFERAVFEYHPQNQDPYKILLRRLGADVLAARGWQ